MSGTLADVSIFSFYASKLMTTGGQGGAIASKDAESLMQFVTIVNLIVAAIHNPFHFQMSDILLR